MIQQYKTIFSRFLMTAAVAATLTGCYDFAELNQDPYNPGYVDGDTEEPEDPDPEPGEGKYADLDLNYTLSEEDIEALRAGQGNMGALFKNLTYEGFYNDYQTTTNLSHDIYSGYIANNKPDFKFNSPNYGYTDGWNANRWNHFYADRTLREYSVLVKTFHFVDPEKYKNAFYITRIYWAFLASAHTDTYGDIPLSDYVKGKEPQEAAKYDTQEKAYDIIFRLLEQAVDSIQPGACAFTFSAEDDQCYGGDETKWLRFANTLRLRLALRISNVDPERAKAEGEAAMANPWGLMQGQADNMRTIPKFALTASGNENALAMCSFAYNGDAVLSKDLELAYKEQSVGGAEYQVGSETKVIDPRCLVCWWRPSPLDALKKLKENTKNDFTGCEIGSDDIQHTESVKKYSVTRTDITDKGLNPEYWFNYSQESVWLGYAELQFLLAEAALRGWSGTTMSAEDYFKAGIQASMDYYQIGSAEAQSYIDGLKIYQDGNTNPFAQGDKEGMLEQIITQKWLAVFPNGNEAWAEFRRTDYPRLRNILNNRSNGEVPDGKFIKRMNYPYSEKDNPNKPLNGTYDYLGHRLWWDVADTNNDNGERNQPNNFR